MIGLSAGIWVWVIWLERRSVMATRMPVGALFALSARSVLRPLAALLPFDSRGRVGRRDMAVPWPGWPPQPKPPGKPEPQGEEPDVTLFDERTWPGQMLTNGHRMWEVLEPPAGEREGVVWVENVSTGHRLWLDQATIDSCRIVIPELRDIA